MPTLTLTEEQLRVVNEALDFYSRVGAGQFDKIKDHPTFDQSLYDFCTPKREPAVKDRTPQGEILEIKDGKALINGSVNKDGHWCEKQEWKPLSKVKLSTDYTLYHHFRDLADQSFEVARQLLSGQIQGRNYGWGIHSEKVDNSCRVAYDIHQVIRHEFWKRRNEQGEDRFHTVDSSVHFTSTKKDSGEIKCEL